MDEGWQRQPSCVEFQELSLQLSHNHFLSWQSSYLPWSTRRPPKMQVTELLHVNTWIIGLLPSWWLLDKKEHGGQVCHSPCYSERPRSLILQVLAPLYHCGRGLFPTLHPLISVLSMTTFMRQDGQGSCIHVVGSCLHWWAVQGEKASVFTEQAGGRVTFTGIISTISKSELIWDFIWASSHFPLLLPLRSHLLLLLLPPHRKFRLTELVQIASSSFIQPCICDVS